MTSYLQIVENKRIAGLKAIAADALKETEIALKSSSDASQIAVMMERVRWTKLILGK